MDEVGGGEVVGDGGEYLYTLSAGYWLQIRTGRPAGSTGFEVMI